MCKRQLDYKVAIEEAKLTCKGAHANALNNNRKCNFETVDVSSVFSDTLVIAH